MNGDWPPPGTYVARDALGRVVVLKTREWTAKSSGPCCPPFTCWLAIDLEEEDDVPARP